MGTPSTASSEQPAEHTTGIVRTWSPERGTGVVDSEETPGGCWVDRSAVEANTMLRAGQVVHLLWEEREHEGYRYVATTVEADENLEMPGG